MLLEDLATGRRVPLPGFLAGRVRVGDWVGWEGRRWRVVDPTGHSVT